MSVEHPRRERFTTYAETLHRRFQTGILATMQNEPLWVLWKPEKDEQGNIHKRPFTPRGYPASIYKPRQWASLASVLEALATGRFAGIGVMLPAPYVLLDKDAKPDAPIYDREAKQIVSPLAVRLLEQVPSYAELSPNNGLHIITEGIPTRGNFKTESLEMYTNWFSTVTTRHLLGTPFTVVNQQAAIQALEDEFHPKVTERRFQNTVGVLWLLLLSLNSHQRQQTTPPLPREKQRYFPSFIIGLVLVLIIIVSVSFYVIYSLLPAHIKPGGAWISPSGSTVGDIIHFAAYAYPTHAGEPAIDHVNFTMYWQGVDPRTWVVACVVHTPIHNDIFACNVNLRMLGTPSGQIFVSFDVYDRQGNVNLEPNGRHVFTYVPSS